MSCRDCPRTHALRLVISALTAAFGGKGKFF